MKTRTMIYLAVAAVALFVFYHWWKTRPGTVDDASSSADVNALFNQLNPTIGNATAPPGPLQNYIPITRTPLGPPINAFGPAGIVVDHYPPPATWLT